MPDEFYLDWLQVMREEAKHFVLLRNYLINIGYDYGDFPAHNGLWEMAQKLHSITIRMALVPRLLEARGLDNDPGIMDKFDKIGDQQAVSILKIIFRDEIGHVRIGNRWYRYCCGKGVRILLNTLKNYYTLMLETICVSLSMMMQD